MQDDCEDDENAPNKRKRSASAIDVIIESERKRAKEGEKILQVLNAFKEQGERKLTILHEIANALKK